MKSQVSRHFARLARSLWRRPAPRPAARRPFRPALDFLEDRNLLSTVSFHAADVFTNSSVNVPRSLSIASVKVQLDITYPLDNDLTIDLIAPNGTDVSLSSFEGGGANFQGTLFDDNAATPVWAADSPFAGSDRPETPLSALAGMNAQGTWQLAIIDWGGSSGTLNSWSLIVQTAGSPNPLLAPAGPGATSDTPLAPPVPLRPLAPVASVSPGVGATGFRAAPPPFAFLEAGDTSIAGRSGKRAAGGAEGSAVPRPTAREAAAFTAVGPGAAGTRTIPAPPGAGHGRRSHLGKGGSHRQADEVKDRLGL
jgi:subtilisin-like proprotein convertase family protein